MKYLYYATFIPGLKEVIAEIVRERLPDAAVHKLLDGAILFETRCPYDKLNFFCFNNIFACIDTMEHKTVKNALETHIKALLKNAAFQDPPALEIIARNSKKFRTFRIVISKENKPAAVNEKIRREAEQYIACLSGLKADRANPDAEFWFLYRSESGCREKGLPETNFSVFMKRLTLRPSWEKSLHPGELPPPLAWTLCCLARLKHSDTVLDPFCGYGSIPAAAMKHFHITRFFACDSGKKEAAYTVRRFQNSGDNSRSPGSPVFHKTDFRNLISLLPPESIDAVVTDPPWGVFRPAGGGSDPAGRSALSVEPLIDPLIGQLYEEMFGVFDTLLGETGRAVVLCAQKEALLRAVQGRFTLQKHIPILLSGRKTGIFLFTRVTIL